MSSDTLPFNVVGGTKGGGGGGREGCRLWNIASCAGRRVSLGFFARGEALPTQRVVRVVCSQPMAFCRPKWKKKAPKPEIRNAFTKPIIPIYDLYTEYCTQK